MLLFLLLLPSISYGLGSVTVGDVIYEQIKLKKEYPSSLFIEHSGGTAFIQKSKLTEDQVASILSGQPQSSNENTAQAGQSPADDGYVYERDSSGNITSIRIPDSVTAVECLKFKDAPELTSVYIGKNTKAFGAQNFHGEKLTKFEVSPENPHYCSEDGVVLSKDKTILVRFPTGREGKYTTPEGVKRIEIGSFNHANKLTEIVVSEGVTEIGRIAFMGGFGALKSVVIADSVVKIEDEAFASPFEFLASVSLPAQFNTKAEFERIGLRADRWASLQAKVSAP